MDAKIKKAEARKVKAGDLVGIGSAIIGGPATGGRHSVPLVIPGGTTHRVVRTFRKHDHITDSYFPYAEVERET